MNSKIGVFGVFLAINVVCLAGSKVVPLKMNSGSEIVNTVTVNPHGPIVRPGAPSTVSFKCEQGTVTKTGKKFGGERYHLSCEVNGSVNPKNSYRDCKLIEVTHPPKKPAIIALEQTLQTAVSVNYKAKGPSQAEVHIEKVVKAASVNMISLDGKTRIKFDCESGPQK